MTGGPVQIVTVSSPEFLLGARVLLHSLLAAGATDPARIAAMFDLLAPASWRWPGTCSNRAGS